MEPEVRHGKAKIYTQFKLKAEWLIKVRGVSNAQAEQDLSVHQSQLRSWVKAFAGGDNCENYYF